MYLFTLFYLSSIYVYKFKGHFFKKNNNLHFLFFLIQPNNLCLFIHGIRTWAFDLMVSMTGVTSDLLLFVSYLSPFELRCFKWVHLPSLWTPLSHFILFVVMALRITAHTLKYHNLHSPSFPPASPVTVGEIMWLCPMLPEPHPIWSF